MSKLVMLTVAGFVAIAIGSVAMFNPVANATSIECSVKTTGTQNTAGNPDSRFVLNNDGTVTTEFEVKGEGCKMDVTLASWQAPDGKQGLPYSDQKLYKYVTGTFKTGKHTLTVALPNCFYQVDVVRGSAPTAPDGSPMYGKERMMGSLHGGTQKCETPVTTTPTKPVKELPTELPSTGPVSTIATLVVLALIAGSIQYFRQSRDALARR